MSEMEHLLRSALVPIEPPASLADRLESRLAELTVAAAEELAEFDRSAMRDPRNWARPAAALVVGGLAGGGLVLLRARRRARHRDTTGIKALERSAREVGDEFRRRLGR